MGVGFGSGGFEVCSGCGGGEEADEVVGVCSE